MTCQADLQVFQGDDYQGAVSVLDSAGNPVDLTGFTAQAQIRIMPAQYWPLVAADITCDILLPNTVNLYIPSTVTVNLYCTYIWDLQLTDANGIVSTILSGNVYTELDVTRAAGAQQAESDKAFLPKCNAVQELQGIVPIGTLPVMLLPINAEL